MLTTTVDGLWVLQVLTGIEVLAPELGLRPILPRVEPTRVALTHPMATELVANGVIDAGGAVDAAVVEWLTVLARRDIGVLIQVDAHGADERDRVLLARFAQWWVLLERSGQLVRIGGAGTAAAEVPARSLLYAQIERLCGVLPPAPLRPITVDADALAAAASSRDTLRDFLIGQRLDGDQLQLVLLATDPRSSARAAIVALQCGVATGRPTRTHVGRTVVTIVDTAAGRLVTEHVPAVGRTWMVIAPGSTRNIASAVNAMVRRLPADRDWHSYRKAV